MNQNLTGQTLIGRYRVVEFIASGSLGAVYRVLDLQRSTSLAMKSLHPELAQDRALLQIFERRAAQLQGLQHAGIVSCYGLQQEGRVVFLLQQYIDGPSLKGILRQQDGQPLSSMQTLACLKAVCAALEHAHSHGIVHGDVRPENILVDAGGSIYLGDFAMTCCPPVSSGHCYRAPEQLPDRDATPAVDIYAAGMLLYELSSGQRPPCSPGRSTTAGAAASQPIPPDLTRLEQNSDHIFAGVIRQALSSHAAARYQNAGELFAAACRAAGIDAQDVPDRIAFPRDVYTSAAGKHPAAVKRGIPLPFILLGGAALLYAALLAGLAGVNWVLPQLRADSAIASHVSMEPQVVIISPLPSDTATITTTPTVTETPLPSETPTPVPTPMGGGSGYIAFASMVKRTPQIFLADINGDETLFTQLTFNRDGACQPDWSPDGQRIVFISPCDGPHYYENYEGAGLYVMNADGSGQTKLPIETELGDFDPAWSPDGKKIAFAGVGRLKTDFSGHLYIYDIEEQTMQPIKENIAVREPQWSPDGSQLVFEMSRGNQTWLVNADGSGEETIITSSNLVAYTPNFSPDGRYIYFGQERNPMLVYKDIEKRAAPASELLELTYYRPAWCPDFSPDGNYLVFSDSDEDSIFTYRLGGDKWDVAELAPGFSPAWRP